MSLRVGVIFLSILLLISKIICQEEIFFPGTEFTTSLIQAWSNEYVLQNPNVKVVYSPMPSDDAFQKLVDNDSIIAAVDNPLTSSAYDSIPGLQVPLLSFILNHCPL